MYLNISTTMGAFLDKPKTEKHNESGEGNGLRYGLSSMQGWRIDMEDNHCAQIGIPDLKDWSFFAVFDGHAGSKVSAYSAQKLLDAIVTNEDFGKSGGEPSVENVKKGIKTGFLGLDESMREIPEMASGEDKSGSTAIVTIISPRHVIFANCGDSRAIFSRDNAVFFSTQDHKPVNPAEKERIQNAGGSVMIQRVNGSLAVSRALGDFEYKNVQGKGPCEQLVSPEPEIQVIERTELDEFLVLACDGVWDVMSNDELMSYIRHCMQRTADLKEVCNSVVDTCLYKGSRDNISIEIIAFEGAPKLSEEAIKKEAELDVRLEAKIKDVLPELLDQCGPNDNVTSLMHLLARDTIDGLPPGGGLAAKRHKIDEILQRVSPTPLEDDLS